MARLPVERHSFVLSVMYFVQSVCLSFPEATMSEKEKRPFKKRKTKDFFMKK
jgi:hypothetical protein